MPSSSKRAALGALLLLVALLVALALATYASVDNQAARHATLEKLLQPRYVRNALGLLGAVLAYYLVPQSLGYSALLLPALVGWYGYRLLVRRPVSHPLRTLLLALIALGLLVVAWGWLAPLVPEARALAGAWGLTAAAWLTVLFGRVGTLGLLLLAVIVAALLRPSR